MTFGPFCLLFTAFPALLLCRRQQGASALRTATPAGVFELKLQGERFVDDESIVVVKLFPCLDISKGFDEDSAIFLVGFTIGLATVVDPAGGVAAVERIYDTIVIDVKVERVVGLLGIVRMPALRLVPSDDFTHILNDALARWNVLQGEHALSVDAGAPGLNAAAAVFRSRWTR